MANLSCVVDVRVLLDQQLPDVLVAVVSSDVKRSKPGLARHVGVVVILSNEEKSDVIY